MNEAHRHHPNPPRHNTFAPLHHQQTTRAPPSPARIPIKEKTRRQALLDSRQETGQDGVPEVDAEADADDAKGGGGGREEFLVARFSCMATTWEAVLPTR